MPENASAGWVATLGGARLTPVLLDGWQQGWVVPPGPAATVVLRFAPDRTYRSALLGGLLLALLLLGLTLPWSAGHSDRRWVGRALPAAGPRPTTGPWLVTTGLLVVLVGGAVGAAAVAVLLVLRCATREGRLALRARSAAGPLAVAAAGGLLALRPWTSDGYAGRGAAAQALCVVGLAATWSMLAGGSTRPRLRARRLRDRRRLASRRLASRRSSGRSSSR